MARGLFVDRKNIRYGRLVALRHLGYGRWECRCDCGSTTIVRSEALEKGKTQSCGCLQRERAKITHTKHGLRGKHAGKKSRLYAIWSTMKARCFNTNNPRYNYYGGRGITVCSEWMDYKNFYEWAIANGYNAAAPKGECTLDRIDNNGNYEPSNCRWVSMSEQCLNRRIPIFPKRRKPVVQIDNDGKIIRRYPSIKAACAETGLTYDGIRKVCAGYRHTTHGTIWRYECDLATHSGRHTHREE